MKLTHTEFFDTPLRKTAQDLIEAGLRAIDTKEAITKRIHLEDEILSVDGHRFDLCGGRVVVLGAGKCSGDALCALTDILGKRLSAGFVIDIVSRHPGSSGEVAVGDHPFPSERNVTHTKKLRSILSGLRGEDKVIFIVSGGGTVLLSDPPPGFFAADETELIKLLFARGATIREMNTVRKHLSFARGGFLATYSKARSLSLIFSDVPGNNLSIISSGPTVQDETTVQDAGEVIQKYAGEIDVGKRALGALIETPKDTVLFKDAEHLLFMSNRVALDAMAARAVALGFSPHVVTDTLEGNAKDIGQRIAGDIANASGRTCLLYAGETTVVVDGHGTGGRNRHVALSALPMVPPGCLVASIASDGIDNGPYAGAIADSGILASARSKGLDPWVFLSNSDSGTFFETVGGYVRSGPTGSNVADLMFAIKS